MKSIYQLRISSNWFFVVSVCAVRGPLFKLYRDFCSWLQHTQPSNTLANTPISSLMPYSILCICPPRERSYIPGCTPKCDMATLDGRLVALVETLRPNEDEIGRQRIAFKAVQVGVTHGQHSLFSCVFLPRTRSFPPL